MRLVIVAVHLQCWQTQWQVEFLVGEEIVDVPDIWKYTADTGLDVEPKKDTGLDRLFLLVCWFRRIKFYLNRFARTE
jgi:hypothetical protein